MKTMNRFLILSLLVFVCLITGCDGNDEDEIKNKGPIIEMAFLKDDGSISDAITSNFLMVHKDGYEKAFIHDNYLVSTFDSANEQSYSIAVFDSTWAYVPSRIVSGDLELVISNFNESTFTFDMNIIYSDSKNLKNINNDKKVLNIPNQKFDPDIELALLKLKKYVFGDNIDKGALQIAGNLNTLRVALADAIKAKGFNNLYWKAVFSNDTAEIKLADLQKNKDYWRLHNYKFSPALLRGIIFSILQNVATDSDWLGKYGDDVSMVLSASFTIGTCLGPGALVCIIALEAYCNDAIDYYKKSYPVTHIGYMEYSFTGSSDTCGCGSSSMTVDFGEGTVKTINNGQRVSVLLKPGMYKLNLFFTVNGGTSRKQILTVNSDNFLVSWYCYCAILKSTFDSSPLIRESYYLK